MTTEILVVRDMSQARRHPQFTPSQIISMYQPHQLNGLRPAAVWYEHLGNGMVGQTMHQRLEDLAWEGVPVNHIDLYDSTERASVTEGSEAA